jgi:hypothetical protein
MPPSVNRLLPLAVRPISVAIFIVLSAGRAMATGTADPAVTFQAQHVVVTGITPGARVMFYAVGLDPKGYYSEVVRWSQTVTDTANTGTVALDLGRPVPWKSIWVVVDLSNNVFVVSSPPGFPARPAPASSGLRKTNTAGVDQIRRSRIFIDALYVTPIGSAWTASAQDGDTTDVDGASDAATAINMHQLQLVDGTGTTPDQLEAGGVLVVIDYSRMDVLAMHLDTQLLESMR